ncbi:MAG TPA: class I SAM-dependent methyltransferase [Acidimicrobiales bacterium]|nr:class I SAM-dependent methyltransferase [Acidimicrobiales bacterium]
MNELHRRFLASPEWGATLEAELLPWLASLADLGDDVLEVGPGPGLTTDILRRRAARVTAVEVDGDLAAALAARLAGTNVEVLEGDATATGLAPDRFSAATCFSVLHHMPDPGAQDRLFAEVFRVLRPGGTFAGIDSVDSEFMRQAHLDDTFVPVAPDTLGGRLEAAGFDPPTVTVVDERVRFVARKGPGAG